MTVAMIREYRCDKGCGATHQTEDKFLPPGWFVLALATFGQSQVEHHLCPACALAVAGALAPGAGADMAMREGDLDENQARDLLRTLIGVNTPTAWARARGLTDEQVSAFLRGVRALEPKLAKAMGLARVRFYRRAEGGQ